MGPLAQLVERCIRIAEIAGSIPARSTKSALRIQTAMLIKNVYKNYAIPSRLQDHMLNVAGVTKHLCDHAKIVVNRDVAIKTALIHDMGAIVKFDLNYDYDLLEPEGIEHWKALQDRFRTKYGTDEYQATAKIISEFCKDDCVKDLYNQLIFTGIDMYTNFSSLEATICCYSDHRVDPYRIVSLRRRLESSKQRHRVNHRIQETNRKFGEYARQLKLLEKQLFTQLTVLPKDIDKNTIETCKKDLLYVDII